MLLDQLVLEVAKVSHSSFRAQPDESKGPIMALCYFTWPGHMKIHKDVLIMNKSSGQK